MANQRKKTTEGHVRLVCTLPNASACISGVAFASVVLEAKAGALHLSERLDPARAEPFVEGGGFEVWDGDEEAHARTIEDALDASRHTAPGADGTRGASAAETDLRRQIDELTRANQAQGAELRANVKTIQDLRAANTKLTTDLAALQATGARAAA